VAAAVVVAAAVAAVVAAAVAAVMEAAVVEAAAVLKVAAAVEAVAAAVAGVSPVVASGPSQCYPTLACSHWISCRTGGSPRARKGFEGKFLFLQPFFFLSRAFLESRQMRNIWIFRIPCCFSRK
jgi:hypothetical protein